MKAFVAVFLLLAAAAYADQELSALEDLYGADELAAVVGNGGLTVATDRFGRIAVCRWPGPGLQDQLSYRLSDSAGSSAEELAAPGLCWGLEVGDEVLWPDDDRWRILQDYGADVDNVLTITARLDGTPIVLSQTIFVDPQSDLLIAGVAVEGVDEPPTLFWSADFSPCTRLVPELPVADWLLDRFNDFATFAVPTEQTIYHFRPFYPDGEMWDAARRLASGSSTFSKWKAFGDGVWIAYMSPQIIPSYTCISESGSAEWRSGNREGGAAVPPAAVGRCRSMIQVTPIEGPGRYEASVRVAFARDADSARALLKRSLESSVEDLQRSASGFWAAWLARADIDHISDPEIRAYMRRSLIAMAVSTDRRSGAIVRGPSVRPPLARDWPRHSAWISYAYDLAGYGDLAEKHAQFLATLTRSGGSRSKPYGSLPSSTYGDGMEASPHLIVDVEAAAWTLWSYRQHALFLEADEGGAFLREVWPAVAKLADFLSAWKPERTGAAIRTFDAKLGRDRPSPEATLSARLAMSSALEIAEILGRSVPPEWNRRLNQLDVLVRNACLDDSLSWQIDDPLPFSLLDVLPLDDPRFERAASLRLAALDALEGVDAARALCEVAMLWRNEPLKLIELRPYVKTVFTRVYRPGEGMEDEETNSLRTPDALAAALAFIAAHLAFSPTAS